MGYLTSIEKTGAVAATTARPCNVARMQLAARGQQATDGLTTHQSRATKIDRTQALAGAARGPSVVLGVPVRTYMHCKALTLREDLKGDPAWNSPIHVSTSLQKQTDTS